MLIKNYQLPLADLLLESSSESDGIKIPDRPSEFLTFVIRKILECGSLPDFLFIVREDENIKNEFKRLFDINTANQAKALLPGYLPEFSASLFDECLKAVQSKPRLFQRASLGSNVRKVLSKYATNPPLTNKVLSWKKFFHMLYHRFISKKNPFRLANGGAFIAFVGEDASGKSTHIANTSKWLGKCVSVKIIHSGLPPATWLTFFPRLLLPAFRKLLPDQRTNFIEFKSHDDSFEEKQKAHYSYFYLIRSIMIAFDQRKLINKARHLADKGEIIISDRYPSNSLGGMDGRRVDPLFFDKNEPFKRFLAGIEKKIYSNISKPNLVFKLSVSLEINLKRFSERNEETKSNPEKQIQCRRAVAEKWKLPGVPIHKIDNSGSLETVQNRIKNLLWNSV